MIETSDGVIISDRTTEKSVSDAALAGKARVKSKSVAMNSVAAAIDRFSEAYLMAIRSMNAHRLRIFLTMLGITIGIASVVAVLALGEGSRLKVLANIASLGTNTLEIFSGKDFGDMCSGKVKTLLLSDAEALARQPHVSGVTPTVSTNTPLRRGSIEANAQVNGVGADYFTVKGTSRGSGRFFDVTGVTSMAQDVVIDENTLKTLFPDPLARPLGQVILVG